MAFGTPAHSQGTRDSTFGPRKNEGSLGKLAVFFIGGRGGGRWNSRRRPPTGVFMFFFIVPYCWFADRWKEWKKLLAKLSRQVAVPSSSKQWANLDSFMALIVTRRSSSKARTAGKIKKIRKRERASVKKISSFHRAAMDSQWCNDRSKIWSHCTTFEWNLVARRWGGGGVMEWFLIKKLRSNSPGHDPLISNFVPINKSTYATHYYGTERIFFRSKWWWYRNNHHRSKISMQKRKNTHRLVCIMIIESNEISNEMHPLP